MCCSLHEWDREVKTEQRSKLVSAQALPNTFVTQTLSVFCFRDEVHLRVIRDRATKRDHETPRCGNSCECGMSSGSLELLLASVRTSALLTLKSLKVCDLVVSAVDSSLSVVPKHHMHVQCICILSAICQQQCTMQTRGLQLD